MEGPALIFLSKEGELRLLELWIPLIPRPPVLAAQPLFLHPETRICFEIELNPQLNRGHVGGGVTPHPT